MKWKLLYYASKATGSDSCQVSETDRAVVYATPLVPLLQAAVCCSKHLAL